MYAAIAGLHCAAESGRWHLNYLQLKQLPVLPPATYAGVCGVGSRDGAARLVLPRVLELTYTAWDLESFATDVGYDGPPFRWDAARRFLLRAELDAAFFHFVRNRPRRCRLRDGHLPDRAAQR